MKHGSFYLAVLFVFLLLGNLFATEPNSLAPLEKLQMDLINPNEVPAPTSGSLTTPASVPSELSLPGTMLAEKLGQQLLKQASLKPAQYAYVTGKREVNTLQWTIIDKGIKRMTAKELYMRISNLKENLTFKELEHLGIKSDTSPDAGLTWFAQIDWLQTAVFTPKPFTKEWYVTVYSSDGLAPTSITAIGWGTWPAGTKPASH